MFVIYIYNVKNDVSPSLPLVCFIHPITLLRNSDKFVVNIMKVYIERNNLQLELLQ